MIVLGALIACSHKESKLSITVEEQIPQTDFGLI